MKYIGQVNAKDRDQKEKQEIRHYDPSHELVSIPVVVEERSLHDFRDGGVPKPTLTGTSVQVMFNAFAEFNILKTFL